MENAINTKLIFISLLFHFYFWDFYVILFHLPHFYFSYFVYFILGILGILGTPGVPGPPFSFGSVKCGTFFTQTQTSGNTPLSGPV